jgi:hypothetical protein
MNLPGETEAGSAGIQPCRRNLAGSSEPIFSIAGPALHTNVQEEVQRTIAPSCLEKPRPERAESRLTENVKSRNFATARSRAISIFGSTARA